MKQIISLLGFLCLFFWLDAQSKTTPFNGLAVGDQIPKLPFSNLLNIKQAVNLNDLKGKTVIIDFWATWCAPCVKMIPRIDSLQNQFSHNLQIVSVTQEKMEVVTRFLSRLNSRASNVIISTNDTIITPFFGLAALPHFAWIDASGKFLGITSDDAINPTTIRAAIDGKGLVGNFREQNEVPYDRSKPFFTDLNPTGDSSVLFHSVFTGFKQGIGPGLYSDVTKADDGTPLRRITANNYTAAQLYQVAMSDGYKIFGWDSTLLGVRDTTALNSKLHGEEFMRWLKQGRGFCYELILPKEKAKLATEYMRNDLKLLFPQYRASVQKMQRRCWALQTVNGDVKAPTAGGKPEADFDLTGGKMVNCYLYVFTKRVAHYLQKFNMPVVNDTGYLEKVDLDIHADLSNIDSINKALLKYNLQLRQKDFEREVLVIEDN